MHEINVANTNGTMEEYLGKFIRPGKKLCRLSLVIEKTRRATKSCECGNNSASPVIIMQLV